jgi:tetratricopeptide (TPR) repeat protein
MKTQSLYHVIFTLILHFTCQLSFAQVGITSYQQGTEYYEQRKYKEAINLYSQAIDSMSVANPKPIADLVKTYNNRGNAYELMDNLLLALFDYDKAIEFDNKFVDAYTGRANIHTRLGKFTKAIADLNKAILLEPKHYIAYYQRGLILLLDIQQYSDAAKDLKLASEKLPKQVSATAYYALCLYELKNYAEALTQTNKAILIDATYADSYYIRAMIFKAQKDKAKALIEIEKALKIASEAPEYKNLKKEITAMK